MFLQINEIFLAAAAAVCGNIFRVISESTVMLFQYGDQSVIIGPVIADIAVDDKVIFHSDLNLVNIVTLYM